MGSGLPAAAAAFGQTACGSDAGLRPTLTTREDNSRYTSALFDEDQDHKWAELSTRSTTTTIGRTADHRHGITATSSLPGRPGRISASTASRSTRRYGGLLGTEFLVFRKHHNTRPVRRFEQQERGRCVDANHRSCLPFRRCAASSVNAKVYGNDRMCCETSLALAMGRLVALVATATGSSQDAIADNGVNGTTSRAFAKM